MAIILVLPLTVYLAGSKQIVEQQASEITTARIEAETATITGPAEIVTDTTASQRKAIELNIGVGFPQASNGSTTSATNQVLASSSATLVLYDNAVSPSFNDGSFGFFSRNACESKTVVSAPCSYAITYQAWGAVNFQVTDGGLDTSGYASLQYKLNTNGQPISDFGVLLTNTAGGLIAPEVVLSPKYVTALSNGWVQVSVPMSVLNPSNVLVATVQLKNEVSTTLRRVYYDDVMFVGGVARAHNAPTKLLARSPMQTRAVLGASSCGVTIPKDAGVATIRNVTLPSAGTFNVFTRMMVPAIGNSYYLQIDNKCPVLIPDNVGTNSWDWTAGGTLKYQKGSVHAITMYGNDPNVKVDELLFSRDCTPSGDGSNCSMDTSGKNE